MLRPDVGELLQGVRRSLRDTVLPAIADPAAQRQMKAALHLLGRLSRTWDLPHALLRSDNADMASTIAAIEARLGPADSHTAPGHGHLGQVAPGSGVNAPELAAEMARNLALREAAEALELRLRSLTPDLKALGLGELHALFGRMTARESKLVGDVSPCSDSVATAKMNA